MVDEQITALQEAINKLSKIQDEADKQSARAFKYISIVKRRFPLIHDEILEEVDNVRRL